ncbi:hypothetical protein CCR75_007211 [Bremia lactucae]|uniref:non-specific serine/threonine protein kinase n=1 Tax=Bremia lactucae TaxID=4779 RepID=A0A976FFT0_BRELC|nr:hypothetical protein CCR75_007211 [Bremia lactucae]
MENYHILERIGVGSFGKVYRGRRKYSGHIVALKFVTKQGKSARDLKNLRQEINILRRLDHCNIIAMLDSFETEGEICIVTEYAQGELYQVLEDGSNLPEEEIRKIAIQLIQALHVIHSNRIIHRDMKPQNILIGSRQQIKLCDFGFARAIAHDSSLLRSIKGTPLYMAPELVLEKPYHYTVDLWSLGVILYELAVGKPPFYTDRIVSLIQMIVSDDVEYPSTMSAPFQSFLKGLLRKDPAQRLQWPKILHHAFIQESPKEIESRLRREKENRTLPRFFRDNDNSPEVDDEKIMISSVERLGLCDDWKICDPNIGQQHVKPEVSNKSCNYGDDQKLIVNENCQNEAFPSESGMPFKSVALQNFLADYDKFSEEMGTKFADAEFLSTPLFANLIHTLPSIPVQELLSDMIRKISALLQGVYRCLMLHLKMIVHVADIGVLLQSKECIQRFLIHLVESTASIQINREQASDVIYKSVRCCMMSTTIINTIEAEKDFETLLDYRQLCKGDVQVILRLLTCKNEVVAFCHSKALKWIGSMMDRSHHLTTLLEVVHQSGIIRVLCNLLHASEGSYSPEVQLSNNGQNVELYATYALALFVHPDAKGWNSLPPFPVLVLVRDDAVSMKNARMQDIRPLNILRVTIHSEVASQLLCTGVDRLIALLGDKMMERGKLYQSGNAETDEEFSVGEEDNDQSTICCILKILLHACRSSAPLSKKLTTITTTFQNRPDADVFAILRLGFASKRLHRIEQYFATELLSVILRREILSQRLIWNCAQTLFSVFLETSDTALLSALSKFFAELIETCHIDESVLESGLRPDDLNSLYQELWSLLVHGALSSRCSDAIARLFSTATERKHSIASEAHMLTSFARASKSNYDLILKANLLPHFCDLVQHPEATVRAKALNCIGNLCRHAATFYSHFATPWDGQIAHTIVAGMIFGLRDNDQYVRRFACFAVGNAAFHSGELYDALRPAIPPLIQNLGNDDEKTRSNAGGALGNLVRNSDELCRELCAHAAPWALFKLAMTETSVACRCVVLFSLGNFCTYEECFNHLVEAESDFISELETLYNEAADDVSRRNIRRIFAKCEALGNEEDHDTR